MATKKTEEVTTKQGFSWSGFFKEAGLPASVCANYAVLFIDNRMKKSMLPDINKEILHELGIRAVGDVIAILRHAKLYCSEAHKSAAKHVPEHDKRSLRGKEEVRSSDHVTRRIVKEKNSESPSSRSSSVSNEKGKDSVSIRISKAKDQRSSKDQCHKKEEARNESKLSKRHEHSTNSKSKRTSPSSSRKNQIKKYEERKQTSSESELDEETYVKQKKRRVVLEELPMDEGRKERRDRKALKHSTNFDTEKEHSPLPRHKNLAREVQFEETSYFSDEEVERTSRLSRLQGLAKRMKLQGGEIAPPYDSEPDEVHQPVKQTVKLILPQPEPKIIRMISLPGKSTHTEMDISEHKDSADLAKATTEIRRMLTKGRRTLDRSRLTTGLDYLGTFKTDYEDEIRPSSLISDQREEKLLNRLGVKPEEKEVEAKLNGSLTILSESGQRKTTSLSDRDRTVIRLSQYDSVYKRLGPEQKVPLKPSTMGVLSADSGISNSSSARNSTVVQSMPEPKKEFVHYDRRALKRRLPRMRTDLRDIIKCKGGFIPSDEESNTAPSRTTESLAPSVKNRLGNAVTEQSELSNGAEIGRRSVLNTFKRQSRESGKSLVGRIVQDVLHSRNADNHWLF